MTEANRLPFLVVSASPYMRGVLKFVLETMLLTEVTELESEEKALNFLKKLEEKPSMIVYDYTPHAYLLEDYVAFLKEHSKQVRIIILVDKVREEGKDILKELSPIQLMDESKLPQDLITEAEQTFAGTQYLNESDYCRINADFLAILDGINKDLFIKVSDKYIKVFNQNENTNLLDIKKYKERGIKYFYLERQTAMWVIDQIQKQINIFLKANNFRFVLRGAGDTPEKRFEQKLLRINDEVHVDSEFQQTIEDTVERIRAVVEKDSNIINTIKVLKEHQKEYSFFTQKMNLVSVIACVLAKQLDWISKSTMDKLVYASVLCDITLAVRPHLLRIQSIQEFERIKDNLTDEDKQMFLSHPKDSANLIKRYFKHAPPDTDSLSYQHHEKADGSGFPQGLKAEKIAPLSALFIIANDFAYYFLIDEEPTMDDFMLRCQSKYDYVNFRKILKALEKIRRR